MSVLFLFHSLLGLYRMSFFLFYSKLLLKFSNDATNHQPTFCFFKYGLMHNIFGIKNTLSFSIQFGLLGIYIGWSLIMEMIGSNKSETNANSKLIKPGIKPYVFSPISVVVTCISFSYWPKLGPNESQWFMVVLVFVSALDLITCYSFLVHAFLVRYHVLRYHVLSQS